MRDFIKNKLVSGLRDVVGDVQGLVPVGDAAGLLPGLPITDYYQALFANSLNVVDGLTQIAEATSNQSSFKFHKYIIIILLLIYIYYIIFHLSDYKRACLRLYTLLNITTGWLPDTNLPWECK